MTCRKKTPVKIKYKKNMKLNFKFTWQTCDSGHEVEVIL